MPYLPERPYSYATLTSPYINTTGKCLELFYYPAGMTAQNLGYLEMSYIREDLSEKVFFTTRNNESTDSELTSYVRVYIDIGPLIKMKILLFEVAL